MIEQELRYGHLAAMQGAFSFIENLQAKNVEILNL